MSVEVDVAKMEERIEALERWQEKQNGQLEKLADKMGELSDRIENKFEAIHERINGTKNWLIATLTSSTIALLLLAANLIIGRP